MTNWFIEDKLEKGFIYDKPKNVRRINKMEIELGEVQNRFAELIWENEPIGSGQLVKLCEKELGWKKPTTYTVLRKLCEKGLFQNENGIVTSVISREEFQFAKSEKVVEENYKGSLPAFFAAFTSRKKLSKEEIEEIQSMINQMREGE